MLDRPRAVPGKDEGSDETGKRDENIAKRAVDHGEELVMRRAGAPKRIERQMSRLPDQIRTRHGREIKRSAAIQFEEAAIMRTTLRVGPKAGRCQPLSGLAL